MTTNPAPNLSWSEARAALRGRGMGPIRAAIRALAVVYLDREIWS